MKTKLANVLTKNSPTINSSENLSLNPSKRVITKENHSVINTAIKSRKKKINKFE